MLKMQSIKVLKNLKNKKVLVRVDFNVLVENDKVVDDFRLRQSLKSINFLVKKKAQVILITHLGKDGSDSLEPIKKHFYKISKLSQKQVSFFENIRKFKGEEKNDLKFAKELAVMGDIFVNEAFSVCHRQHASIVGLPKYLPSYAGFNLEAEINNLNKVFKKTKHPFLFILGGAKFSTKLPLVQKYLKKTDEIVIGGALANNFLKDKNFEIGKSLIEDFEIPKFVLNSKKIFLAHDFLISDKNVLVYKKIENIQKEDSILDIGPSAIKEIIFKIKKAKMILWNGPLGKYEEKGDQGTKKILKAVLASKAEIVIGGGDIVTVLSSLKYKKNKNLFISTGGGATLEYLAQGNLPGIKALG